MLSKFLPWDFLQKYPQIIDSKKPGIYAFLVSDPYMQKVLFNKLPKEEIPMSLYSGNEVSREFIEEHFVNLSFFSTTEHIRIINSENISPQSLEFLEELSSEWQERFLVLFFSKSSKAFLDFSKKEKIIAIEIEEPRFWEGAKLWQFCQKVNEINLPPDVSRFVLEHLEHNFESFFWMIETIKMNFPDGRINLDELRMLVKKERWDFFELIEIFNHDPNKFFREILKKDDGDYEWMRALFAFMQAHLIKVLSPDELRNKGKLSKYDQSVLILSERWKRKDIVSYLQFFSELEVLAKSSDQFLINQLRLKII